MTTLKKKRYHVKNYTKKHTAARSRFVFPGFISAGFLVFSLSPIFKRDLVHSCDYMVLSLSDCEGVKALVLCSLNSKGMACRNYKICLYLITCDIIDPIQITLTLLCKHIHIFESKGENYEITSMLCQI